MEPPESSGGTVESVGEVEGYSMARTTLVRASRGGVRDKWRRVGPGAIWQVERTVREIPSAVLQATILSPMTGTGDPLIARY